MVGGWLKARTRVIGAGAESVLGAQQDQVRDQ